MDNQEAFDIVKRHLLTQKKISVNHEGVCQYRGPDGLKCAIGALIPDEIYNPTMENHTIKELLSRAWRNKHLDSSRALLEVLGKVDENLLKVLQFHHDIAPLHEAVQYWMVQLKEVARVYNLKWED